MANLATERINVRSTVDAKIVIEQAANLLGLSVSSFMIQSSFERAKELLKSNHELKVNNADRDMLMNLLDDDAQVRGFYCLSSTSIGFDGVDAVLTKRLPRYPLPCVVVGRFAVDQAAQGQGVGKVLLAHALKQVSKVAQIIGVNFVVIHAKDQKAMKFYQRFGFISLTSNPLTLIYPVNEIPHFK